MVFAHCGDSRAYLVRDGIAMQLTEDHTLLARLLAAGVDVDTDGEGSRFKSDADERARHRPRVQGVDVRRAARRRRSVPAVQRRHHRVPQGARDRRGAGQGAVAGARGPEARRDRARARRRRQRDRAGRPRARGRRDRAAVGAAAARERRDQQLPAVGEGQPAAAAARAAHRAAARPRRRREGAGARRSAIASRGSSSKATLEQDGELLGPGSLRLSRVAALATAPLPDKDSLAVAKTEVRALALRSDDFRELCEDDADLAEHLLASLGDEIAKRAQPRKIVVGAGSAADWRGSTDPGGAPRGLRAPIARAATETDSTRARTATGAARAATEPPRAARDPDAGARAPPAPAAGEPAALAPARHHPAVREEPDRAARPRPRPRSTRRWRRSRSTRAGPSCPTTTRPTSTSARPSP